MTDAFYLALYADSKKTARLLEMFNSTAITCSGTMVIMPIRWK